MPNSYVCSACRLSNLVSRLRLERARKQRWFSHSASTWWDVDKQQNPPTIGRYSRKVLHAQQLYGEGRAEGARTKLVEQAQDADHQHTRHQASDRNVPKSIHQSITTIERCLPKSHDLNARVQVLESLRELESARSAGMISSVQLHEALRPLGSQSANLQRLCERLVMDHVQYMQGRYRAVAKPPSVTDVIDLLQRLGLVEAGIWRRVLARYTYNMAAARAMRSSWDESRGGQLAAMHDLLTVWELRIKAGLGRGGTSFAAQGPDLTVLPTPQSVLNLRKRLKLNFVQAFDMLIPPLASNGIVHADSIMDTSSAALVTYYLVTTWSESSAQSSPDTELIGTEPFTEFMSALLKPVGDEPLSLSQASLANQIPATNGVIRSYFANMEQQLGMKRLRQEERITQGTEQRKSHKSGESTPETGSQTDGPFDTKSSEKTMPRESFIAGNGVLNGNTNGQATLFANTAIKRLGRAVNRQHQGQVQQVLSEVEAFERSAELPLSVYEHLISASFAVQKPSITVKAWQLMSSAGLTPTVQTWTVMMKGCQKIRDVAGLERAWKTMRANDLKPDAHAWSTRIFGLIMGNKVEEGLIALDEMARDYITAARSASLDGPAAPSKVIKLLNRRAREAEEPLVDISELPSDINSVPRPSLAVMNAAISALASKNDEHISEVLTWGRRFGIEPDLTTFNVLLNVCLRHAETDQALDILKQMEAKGIQPDSQTLTIQLTGLFQADFLGQASKQEQQEKILAVIDSLETAGNAKIDQKGYALVIDRLLKVYSNGSAAQQVMERMAKSGVQITNHIYTILLTYYFSQQPPDVAAVNSIWQHLQTTSNGFGSTIDSILYDRLVEGYARHHEHFGTAPMLKVLHRMSQEGKSPSWPALELVARALADRNEWDILAGIVDDVRHDRAMSVKISDNVGQESFWYFIIGTGLLRDAGITHPRDVRTRSKRKLSAYMDAAAQDANPSFPSGSDAQQQDALRNVL